MSTSQNGYPALSANSSQLHSWVLPTDTKVKIQMRHGACGFVLAAVAVYVDRRAEDIDRNYKNGEKDDWGYAFRAVRGYSSTLSNHSSGTAIDLNATEHPLGVSDTWSDQEERYINWRLRSFNGCVRWGNYYKGRKDGMHFEIDRPIAPVNRLAVKYMQTAVGKEILRLNPSQKAVILK